MLETLSVDLITGSGKGLGLALKNKLRALILQITDIEYVLGNKKESLEDLSKINPDWVIDKLKDKTDGKYYIGLPGFIRNTHEYILSSSVSNATFFKYDFNSISRFLVDYSCDFIFNPCIHILQLHISNSGVYNVTLKTFWLKIVQFTKFL